jgi:hypothetical protein
MFLIKAIQQNRKKRMEETNEIMINIENGQLNENMKEMDVNDPTIKMERANV